MALHLVTGYAGTEHITSQDQGAYDMATFAEGEFVFNRLNKFEATIVSNNLITLADGEAMMQGRYIRMTPGTTEEIAIENGTQGMLRKDLICLRYEKNSTTGVESIAFVVKKGTEAASNPADPTYTTGEITDGDDLVNEMPLYRVNLDGLNIASIDVLFAEKEPGGVGITDLSVNAVGILPIEHGGTGNNHGYIRTGQKASTTMGNCATAEGYSTTSSGNYSHAEGYYTEATGTYDHAEGYFSRATGNNGAHAEGYGTQATESGTHAEGWYCKATGASGHAEGNNTIASGHNSHAEGNYTTAEGRCHHAQGHYNKKSTSGSDSGTSGDAMYIGNGTSSSLSNAFRVTFAGAVYGLSAFNSSGADYSEFFEWDDENPNNEDRVGYFVTLDGEKIKIANADDYILGIVSGHPSVIGNGDEDWQHRWMKNDFGRRYSEEFEYEVPVGEDETQKETGTKWIENPDYDSSQEYVERKDRAEWDTVAMLGQIEVRDDGTCEVNSYCKPADNGIATKADTGYRVIARISDNVVRIIMR